VPADDGVEPIPGPARFFIHVVEEDEITESPMARTKPSQVQDVPVPVLGDDELRHLLAACEGGTFEERRDTAIVGRSWPTCASRISTSTRTWAARRRAFADLSEGADSGRFAAGVAAHPAQHPLPRCPVRNADA